MSANCVAKALAIALSTYVLTPLLFTVLSLPAVGCSVILTTLLIALLTEAAEESLQEYRYINSIQIADADIQI